MSDTTSERLVGKFPISSGELLEVELKALAEQGDLTSAMIRYQQRKEELECSARPASFGGYGRRR